MLKRFLITSGLGFVLIGAGCLSTDDRTTITGTYSYSDMLGIACFSVNEEDRDKLPEETPSICFTNSDEAKAELENTSGEVTITISDIAEASADYVDPGKYKAIFIEIAE